MRNFESCPRSKIYRGGKPSFCSADRPFDFAQAGYGLGLTFLWVESAQENVRRILHMDGRLSARA
jgi:hypothetical protein